MTADAGAESPAEDEVASLADNDRPGPDVTEIDDRVDGQVPWRVFGVISAFVLATSVLYGVTSGEEAGTAMLAVSSLLAGWCGVFLWNNARRFEAGHGAHAEGDGALYLPDASPWPLGIGFGLTLVLNGLLIGTWFLVPGVMVLAVSLAGWARQSRHRA